VHFHDQEADSAREPSDEGGLGAGWEERLGKAIGSAISRNRHREDDEGYSGSLLQDDKDNDKYLGARGVASYETERRRCKRFPEARFQDVKELVEQLCGARPGSSHKPQDALVRLPCGTYNTVKRVLAVFLEVMDGFIRDDLPHVRGVLAQAIRWLVLFLYVPSKPDLCWKVTFLQDPLPLHTVRLDQAPDILDGALQDPRQLTSIVGLQKDLAAITANFSQAGGAREPWWKKRQNATTPTGGGEQTGQDGVPVKPEGDPKGKGGRGKKQ